MRQAALLSFEERLKTLEAIADGKHQTLRPVAGGWSLITGSTADEILKAILGLAKLGGVESIELSTSEGEGEGSERYGIFLMPPLKPKPAPPGANPA